jgi:hypothetical protein
MKSLKQFIVESQKTYEFKVKLACDSDDLDMDRVEQAVASFEPVEITKPKSLPYQKSAEFPNAPATQIQLITVVTKYPSTPEQIRALIANRCNFHESNIIVRTAAQELEFENQQIVDPGESAKEAILTQDYEDSDHQDLVGQQAVDRVMKDHKSREYEFAGDKTARAKTLNDDPTGKMSAVGSHQNKIPDPYAQRKGK